MANQSQFQIDLERVANQPVSEGIHPFVVTSVEEGEGEKGPYWRFTCACENPAEQGKTVTLFMSLSPQARWRLEIFLDAVGAPTHGSLTADRFVGKRFRGQVTHEDYNGRPQARVDEMYPASSTAGQPAARPNGAVSKVAVSSTVGSDTPGGKATSKAPVTKGKPAAGKQAIKTAVPEQDELPF